METEPELDARSELGDHLYAAFELGRFSPATGARGWVISGRVCRRGRAFFHQTLPEVVLHHASHLEGLSRVVL